MPLPALHGADLAGFDPSASGLELEQAQLAAAFAGAVFVTDSLSVSITRYELNDEGALVAASLTQPPGPPSTSGAGIPGFS